MNTVHLCDCMEYMRNMPDGSVDLIITSPPYNLGSTHHTGSNRFKAYNSYDDDLPEGEYQEWQIAVLDQCYRILSDEGSMMYNHKIRIVNGVSIVPYEWIFKTKFLVKQEIVWFNGSQNFDKIRFYPMTERVYWLAKTNKTVLQNVINHHDLFEWKAVGTKGEHKRAFPEQMVTDLMRCFPNARTVFDPFTGSGTTRMVAHKLGKDFVGCEIDKGYWEEQENRFNEYLLQGVLFSHEEIKELAIEGDLFAVGGSK